MQNTTLAVAFAALALPIMATTASAGPIERACRQADGGNRAVCSCIQQVADMTLRGADQRRAAKLMKDPDLAHEVWISKRESDDQFWERYKAFGEQAGAYCGS